VLDSALPGSIISHFGDEKWRDFSIDDPTPQIVVPPEDMPGRAAITTGKQKSLMPQEAVAQNQLSF